MLTRKLIFLVLLPFIFPLFYYFKDLFVLYVISKIFFPLFVLSFSFLLFLTFLKRNVFFPYTFMILASFVFLDLISAIGAYFHFKQNILCGILGQVKLLPFFFYFFVFYLLKKLKPSISELENIFVAWMWLTLITYYILQLTLDPSQFNPKVYKFVVYDNQRGYRFLFPSFFIILGVFYYWEKVLRKKSILSLFSAGLFIFYLFYFVKVRFVILGITSVLIYQTFRIVSLRIKVFIVLTTVILLYMMVTSIPYFQSIITLRDSSLNLRLMLTVPTIISFWKEDLLNLFLPAGYLNPVCGTTLQDIFGEHFWPVDVGLMGIIFEFGLIGTFIIILNYLVIFKEIKKLRVNLPPIIAAIRDYLVFNLLVFWWASPIPYNLGYVMSAFAIIVYYNKFRDFQRRNYES